MINELVSKRVKIGVAFMPVMGKGSMTTKYFEGNVKAETRLGGEIFLILDNNSMINMKYVQTIEIIG